MGEEVHEERGGGGEGACETISSNLLFHLLSFMCKAPNIINF